MKISVCLATYNGEAFLEEQLCSIISQLGTEDEIIISDDFSTDSTASIIHSFNDTRIKYILNQTKTHSPVSNFQNALEYATGDIIFLSDQDDIWLPSKVEKCIKALDSADLVLHDAIVVDKFLVCVSKSLFSLRHVKRGYIANLYKNSYIGCCMAFKKNVINYVLPFPKRTPMHDVWIGLNAELLGKVSFISEPLIMYRRHGNNASNTVGKSNMSIYYQFNYRLILLINTLMNLFTKRNRKIHFYNIAGLI